LLTLRSSWTDRRYGQQKWLRTIHDCFSNGSLRSTGFSVLIAGIGGRPDRTESDTVPLAEYGVNVKRGVPALNTNSGPDISVSSLAQP
jgi:hypothetical protein